MGSCILVGHTNLLRGTGGGVQLCNREYKALLEAAGFQIHELAFTYDHSPLDRIFRRVGFSTRRAAPKGLEEELARALQSSGARHVFFSLDLFGDLSEAIRRRFPQTIQILLSHGVEAIDAALEQTLCRTAENARTGALAQLRLGRELVHAAEARRWIDGVITLSPLEITFEKWLGTKACLWAPAVIADGSLAWKPVEGRVGSVSTLDHPPNAVGLTDLFQALSARQLAPQFEFRLVGQPKNTGAAIARRFPFVRYLGSLSDSDLRQEAASWCSFVNPIFVGAKGRSTKIGMALQWGLPIATTEWGVRGYVWDQAVAPTPATPEALAALVVAQSHAPDFDRFRKMTATIISASPGLDTVAAQVRSFIAALPDRSAVH